jgi:Zn ribbon nucleic-acid-binding protein
MAPTLPEPKAGDVCPMDGGAFVIDEAQDPEKVIDRHTRNAQSAFVAARFAERVREKTKEHGVIHKCVTCGYRSRFQPADAGDKHNDEADRERDGNQSARADNRGTPTLAAADRRPKPGAAREPAGA